MNADRFLLYVQKVLAPTLQPGDMVVVDNLQSHKRADIRQAMRNAGAKLVLLPKYSPDLNPIEQVFAKLKHLLRKAEARSQLAVSRTIGTLLSTYSAEECANYFRNSGYDHS
jgi:transposase